MASPEPRWPGLAAAWPDRPPAASGERGRSARLLVAHPVAWPDRARWTGPLGAAVRRDLRREPLVRPPSSVGAAAGPRAGRCRPTTHMRPSPRPRGSRWYNAPAGNDGRGRLQLARAAMAGLAGVGENLRRRLAGIQVRLRLGRQPPPPSARQTSPGTIQPNLDTTTSLPPPGHRQRLLAAAHCPKFLAEKRMRPRCPALPRGFRPQFSRSALLFPLNFD